VSVRFNFERRERRDTIACFNMASASAVELVALALTIQSLRSIGDQWLTAIPILA
jgi:hypothetical protein